VADDDAPLSAPPDVIVDLAAACVRFVEQATGVRLDFTQDTLGLLDHYGSIVREERREELLALLVPAAGAYFGEVVRRALGDGRWELGAEGYEAHRLVFDALGLRFNPIGIALECLVGEVAPGFGAHFDVDDRDRAVLAEALDAGGPVSEDDFHRFAVRFEVVEHVAATLAALRERERAALH
jgi:hypothetical protein